MTNIQKWLEALESGEYKQTVGTLHNKTDGGFCCLGVAAKVVCNLNPQIFGVEEDDVDKDLSGEVYLHEGDADDYNLVKSYLGLNSNQYNCVIEMNDSGSTFKDIADYIREEIKKGNLNDQADTEASTG